MVCPEQQMFEVLFFLDFIKIRYREKSQNSAIFENCELNFVYY